MTAQIGRTVLRVRDLDASSAFYRDAFGFATLHDETTPSFRFLHVGPGGVRDPGLWLMPTGAGAPSTTRGAVTPPPSGPHLVLYVDDLAVTVRRLRELDVELDRAVVHDTTSGQTYAHVLDPDGHELVLVQLVPVV